MNQTRIHPPAQVVLKNHARDLDLIDRAPTKPPAHPAGNLQLPTSIESAGQDACEVHALMRVLWLINRLRGTTREFSLTVGLLPNRARIDRKNINVKRVNC